MAFRIVELSSPCEVHVKEGQLVVEKYDNKKIISKFNVPLSDIEMILCMGPAIRFSTLGMIKINQEGVAVTLFDEKYKISSVIIPYSGNSRNAMVVNRQIDFSKDNYNILWQKITKKKIENQLKCLKLLKKECPDFLYEYIDKIDDKGDSLNVEGTIANYYFSYYSTGLKRREENPINSVLNYGYAILRNCIIKNIILTGLNPIIGIHHNNKYNELNLADDIIEPFRPMIDIIALDIAANNIDLTPFQRQNIIKALYNECEINGEKMQVKDAIEKTVISIKEVIVNNKIDELKLPDLQEVKYINPIKV